ncbi:hypothetical protein PVL29_026190 [Vitis rotundifolia]|uniref:Uncharacterized protein n=1 Tax=Vitis rotundifolia TaxID=103349 RepID=A0AA38YLV4_VITRO|nr:hypothetical protein PVL29_026190 [Vitis rotundifolia]
MCMQPACMLTSLHAWPPSNTSHCLHNHHITITCTAHIVIARFQKKTKWEKQRCGVLIFGRRGREKKLKKASYESKEEEESFSSMAEVSCFLHFHEDKKDHDLTPEHIDTLDCLPYWGLYDFDIFNVFLPDHPPITHLLYVRAVDMSKPDSITIVDLLDRENQRGPFFAAVLATIKRVWDRVRR